MFRASTAEEIRNDSFMYSEYSFVKIHICANVEYYKKNQGVIKIKALKVFRANSQKKIDPTRVNT